MANTQPTPVSFLAAVRLVLLLIFKPKRFLELQAENSAVLNAVPNVVREESAFVVRRVFFTSFLLVLVSAGFGYVVGLGLGQVIGCVSSGVIVWFQIVGTSLLLWGTLFIRGWDIQTYGGVSLTERVNQWIYRALYCAGTAILVASLALPSCAN